MTRKIFKVDFLCDMELGICSCTTGSTGAACRHQVAAAKHFKLVSVNRMLQSVVPAQMSLATVTQACVLLMTKVAGFKTELNKIMDDLTDHIANGDHTIISGVSKFIKSMMKSHAPNASISCAQLSTFRQ